mmetsp:Transcript_16393/g.42292  ORF Transcript_16393/g.42292 Transcript_16393/m.42292 type:complete len:315 (+) Transcript_16393:159-1103(+)
MRKPKTIARSAIIILTNLLKLILSTFILRENHNTGMAKEKQKTKKEKLFTEKGRDEAHEAWTASVREFEEQKAKMDSGKKPGGEKEGCVGEGKKDPVHQVAPQKPSAAKPLEKPVNSVMNCCAEGLAVAMRLGETEVATKIVLDHISQVLDAIVDREVRRGVRDPDTLVNLALEATPRVTLNVLTRRLDDDGNHSLHYAVYVEDYEMVSFMVSEARRADKFAEFVTRANDRGQTALDFAVCCTKDPRIPDYVKTLLGEATEILVMTWIFTCCVMILFSIPTVSSTFLLENEMSFSVVFTIHGCWWLFKTVLRAI